MEGEGGVERGNRLCCRFGLRAGGVSVADAGRVEGRREELYLVEAGLELGEDVGHGCREVGNLANSSFLDL